MYYYPDRWIVVEIKKGSDSLFKVFGTWYSSQYAWRLNSGITNVALNLKADGLTYIFTGYSKSEYVCIDKSYGLCEIGQEMLNDIIRQLKEYNYADQIIPLTKEEFNQYVKGISND